jgi:hypothetical protein
VTRHSLLKPSAGDGETSGSHGVGSA